jgi:ribosomal protein S20
MLKKKSILSIAAAGVALMTIAGYASADATTASTTSTTQQAQQGHHKGQFSNQQLLTLLKIDASTLQQDLKAGQSLAGIASTQGVSEQDVINLLVQQSTDRINKAVSAGKLTQDKATQREANLPAQVKKMVEHKGGFSHKQNGQGQLKQVASILGIDPTQLMTQLKAGQSIADIAAAQGKDEQTVINTLMTQATTKINAAVQAGKLTQDKATQMEAKLPDRIKKLVERKGFGKQHNTQQASQITATTASTTTN